MHVLDIGIHSQWVVEQQHFRCDHFGEQISPFLARLHNKLFRCHFWLSDEIPTILQERLLAASAWDD